MLKLIIKLAFYLFVFIGFSSSFADSYNDFFRALIGDDTATLRALVGRGFDPNARDPNGQPAVSRALMADANLSAEALIAQPGFDPNALNRAGETPLMIAALKGQPALCEALIARGAAVRRDGWTPAHYAAAGNSLPALRVLLGHGADVDARAPNGRTPLMMAALHAGEDVIEALLAAGADPSVTERSGATAADLARASGREWLAVQLEKRRAR